MVLIALLLIIAIWCVYRVAKYPMAKGLGIFAPLMVPSFLLNRGTIAMANRFLISRGRPKCRTGVTEECGKIEGCGVEYVIYRPEGEEGPLPLLIYFHGGGFFFEASGYLYRKCMDYAAGAKCAVAVVRYRTSNIAPWPAAHEDALSALKYFHDNADAFHFDTGRIALGGDSAGGEIAAGILAFSPCRIKFLLLVYPVTDNSMTSPSTRKYTDSPCWNSRLSKKMWRIYLADSVDYVPPLARKVASHPATYIEVAQFDSLRDEAVAYAEKLKSEGVSVTLNEVKGACHGYDVLQKAPLVREMMAQRIEALRQALWF